MREVRLWVSVTAAAVIFAVGAIGASTRTARAAQAVDVALVLAADVSRSINEGEFALQRRGYAAAIADPRVIEAIGSGPHGAIVVSFVEWAGDGEQKTVVGWTVIHDVADARQFAATLVEAPRSFVGRTAIGSAIDFSFGLLAAGGFEAERRVIDISGDGVSNQGRQASDARDAALRAGVTINGLAIFNKAAADEGGYLARHTNPPGGLARYYHDNVIGGPGSFVLPIDDFNSFEDAMIRKLITEIAAASPAGDEQRRAM